MFYACDRSVVMVTVTGAECGGKKRLMSNAKITKWQLMFPAQSRDPNAAFTYKLLLVSVVECASCERDGRWGKGSGNRYYALL